MTAFDEVPANRHFGFRLLERSAQGATIAMEPRADLMQEEGVVHGGALSALADSAAVHAFYEDLPPDRSMTSIEFKVSFLSSARDGDGTLLARSRVVRRGARVGVCEVEVTQRERLVAKGLFTYLFLERHE